MRKIIYLATPYSAYPYGFDAAAVMAAEAAARLTNLGVVVFSPIVHGHEMAATGLVSAAMGDHDFWLGIDAPFMAVSSALVVYQEQGWDASKGIAHEIAVFRNAGKPIFYWPPLVDVPVALLEVVNGKPLAA